MSELEKKNLLIDPSGNVGIGTDNPACKLHVKTNDHEGKIIIENETLSLLQLKQPESNKTYNIELGRTDGELSFRSTTGEKIRITENGYIGMGTIEPEFPLHVTTEGSNNHNYIGHSLYAKGGPDHSVSNHRPNTSAYFQDDICAKSFGARSDKRIKTDISPIIDDTALKQVNALESYEYHYINPEQRRTMKTIGFIAQEVKGVIPNAVTLLKNYIPDEMRIITNPKWEGNTLTIPDVDMSSNMTGKAKFYVSNDQSGNNEICKEVEIKEIHTGDSTPLFPKTKFVADFDQKWNNVFFYGKEVTDFHIIDKAQIFALHHSAIQELSRQNDAKTLEITNLKDKVNTLEDKLNKVMHHLGMN